MSERLPVVLEIWQQAELVAREARHCANQAMLNAYAAPVPPLLRPAVAADIVEGGMLWYPAWYESPSRVYPDGQPAWCIVGEVHSSSDAWKAFTAGIGFQEGCRHGLEGAFVAVELRKAVSGE